MQVSQENLEDWNKNVDPGDKKKLVEYTGYSHPMITAAFNGTAPEDLIIKMNTYFLEKRKRVTQSFNSLK